MPVRVLGSPKEKVDVSEYKRQCVGCKCCFAYSYSDTRFWPQYNVTAHCNYRSGRNPNRIIDCPLCKRINEVGAITQ